MIVHSRYFYALPGYVLSNVQAIAPEIRLILIAKAQQGEPVARGEAIISERCILLSDLLPWPAQAGVQGRRSRGQVQPPAIDSLQTRLGSARLISGYLLLLRA